MPYSQSYCSSSMTGHHLNFPTDSHIPPHCLRDAAATSTEVAAIINGKAIAEEIRAEIAEEVEAMRAAVGKVPGLAVVLVGTRKDSETYVRSKRKACAMAGIASFGVDLPEDASEGEVLAAVEGFNADPAVHGVLVQLPLPKVLCCLPRGSYRRLSLRWRRPGARAVNVQHMSEERIVGAVSLEKDVDGFHPVNIGRLAMTGRQPRFLPCTPKGCLELLVRSGAELDGKRAVVIGRSNVVGMPAALLLQRYNATVTVVHSHTQQPEAISREADIIIAGAGVANLVRGDWIKPGAIVIDVGINPVEDANTKRGYRLVGDVCFEEARHVASAITPVPGGVGPMTIAMLLANTLLAAKRAYGLIDD
eukprot:SM000022S07252  [mRNA]  locus=s22:822836:825068:+ [translate_table: standard]